MNCILQLISIVSFAMLFSVGTAHAQNTAIFSVNSSVSQAISLSNTATLNFGNIIPGTGGTVTVSAAGVRSSTGGVTPVGGTVSPASFSVTGSPSTAYTITLPATDNLTGPGTPIPANFFSYEVTGGSLSRSLDGAGNDSFSAGSTIAIANAQAPGVYSGTFTMTVAY